MAMLSGNHHIFHSHTTVFRRIQTGFDGKHFIFQDLFSTVVEQDWFVHLKANAMSSAVSHGGGYLVMPSIATHHGEALCFNHRRDGLVHCFAGCA